MATALLSLSVPVQAPAPARPALDPAATACVLALAAYTLAMGPAAGLAALGLVAAGAVAGVAAGVVGVGGGFLVMPLLAALGLPLATAAGTSLAYVACVAAGAAWGHLRSGACDRDRALALALAAAPGGVAGAMATAWLPDRLLAVGLAGFLTFVAWQTCRAPGEDAPGPVRDAEAGEVLAGGVAIGLASGLFGVGGGLLATSWQTAAWNVPLKRAIATSSAVVFATAAAGTLAHAGLGHLDAGTAGWLVLGGLAAVGRGAALLAAWPVARVKAGMFAVVAAAALQVLSRAL